MTLALEEARYLELPCPLCGGGALSELYRGGRFTGTSLGRVTVAVAQCDACGFVFNSPRPSDETLARFYAEDPLASGRTFRDVEPGGYYPRLFAERAHFYAPLLLGAERTRGRLLDVGCGRGGFLGAMAEYLPPSWELVGLEPCAEAGQAAAREGFEVHRGGIEERRFPDDSFDVVSLVSVLEHLTDPAAALREVARLLRPGGLVLLEVPNTLHPEPSLTSYFGLEHVCHFTPGSLAGLLRTVGLGQIRVDDRVAGHGLRLVAAADLSAWGVLGRDAFGDDRDLARERIRRYAEAERELIERLRRRAGAALERWSARGWSVAVYGAGVHTAELSAHVDLWGHASFLVDGDRAKQGTTFLGLPVHAPEALAERGVRAVLISSHRFADEMEATVRRLCGADVEVARCYGPDDPPFVS